MLSLCIFRLIGQDRFVQDIRGIVYEEPKERRKRIPEISDKAPGTLGDLFNASSLGLDTMNLLVQEEKNEALLEITGLRAVWLRHFP
jgi:hypothetical protein